MSAFTVIMPKLPIVKGDPKKAEPLLKGWAGRVHSRVAKYPPQRATRYRRTGTLGRGWNQSFGRDGGSLVATVRNAVPYAPYVQGERQTGVSAGYGWPNLQKVGDEEWKRTEGDIRKALGG